VKRKKYRYIGDVPITIEFEGKEITLKPGQFISRKLFLQLPKDDTIEQEVKSGGTKS
jgi:hypothetical protein